MRKNGQVYVSAGYAVWDDRCIKKERKKEVDCIYWRLPA